MGLTSDDECENQANDTADIQDFDTSVVNSAYQFEPASSQKISEKPSKII